jgi:hypothetical protein
VATSTSQSSVRKSIAAATASSVSSSRRGTAAATPAGMTNSIPRSASNPLSRPMTPPSARTTGWVAIAVMTLSASSSRLAYALTIAIGGRTDRPSSST